MKKYFIALFLICISGVAHAQPPEEASRETVLAEANEGGYNLISFQELATEFRSRAGSLLVVDTRQEWAYQAQHIHGAVSLPVAPAWWYQYSPSARSEMKKVLGSDINRKIVFY